MATFSIPKRAMPVPPESAKKASRGQGVIYSASRLVAFLILLISAVCFLYLSEFNAIASQGVIIHDVEIKRSKLIIENEVWNMRIAQLKSMDVIQHQDVVKKMPNISPSELDFIDLDRKKGDADPEKKVPLDFSPPLPLPVDNNIE